MVHEVGAARLFLERFGAMHVAGHSCQEPLQWSLWKAWPQWGLGRFWRASGHVSWHSSTLLCQLPSLVNVSLLDLPSAASFIRKSSGVMARKCHMASQFWEQFPCACFVKFGLGHRKPGGHMQEKMSDLERGSNLHNLKL